MDTGTRDKSQKNLIIALSIIAILSGAGIIYIIVTRVKRSRKLRNRRKQLLKDGLPRSYSKQQIVSDKLPDEVRNRLAKELSKFESELGFRDPKMTSVKLAQYLKTNTSYLSNFINQERGCPVNEYLSNLRIEFAFKLLIEDKKFRSYSVKALSEEVGFGSQQTFSRLFKERAGIGLGDFCKGFE